MRRNHKVKFYKCRLYVSGNNVGSNKYREFNKMHIVYGQVYPKELRKLYSVLFTNQDLSETDREATAQLMGVLYSQLIGRIAIRKSPETEAVVNIYGMEKWHYDKVIEHFMIPEENITTRRIHLDLEGGSISNQFRKY